MIAGLLLLLAIGAQPSSAPAQENSVIDGLRAKLTAQPDSAILKRSLGEQLFHLDPNSAEAGKLLEEAVTAVPRDPEAKHYFAQWAYFNNREQICVDQETQALSLPALNDRALLQMYTLEGFCDDQLGNSQGAGRAFANAFAVDTRQKSFDAAIAYRYVDFLVKQGREEEAQRVTATILQRNSQFGPAHLVRAKYFEHKKQTEKAIEQAQLAIRGEGNDAQTLRAAHMLLAKNYFALGDTAKSQKEQDWIKAQIVGPSK